MAGEAKKDAGQRTDAPANPDFNDTGDDFGLNLSDYEVRADGVYIGGFKVDGDGVRLEQDVHKVAFERGQGFIPQDDGGDEEPPPEAAKAKTDKGEQTEDEGQGKEDGQRQDADEDGEQEGDGEEKPGEEGVQEQVTQKEWTLKVLGEERKVTDEAELVNLAQKGLGADAKFEEVAKMRKELEPYYHIAIRLKDDPEFVKHVQNFGREDYMVDGPEPATVTQEQFQKILDDRTNLRLAVERDCIRHDIRYEPHKGYPLSDEVRGRMLTDSINWDRSTRQWVDANPQAYRDKFQETLRKMIAERGLPPEPQVAQPAPSPDKEKALREQIKGKEVAKEKARVESAKVGKEIAPDDGRLAVNRAIKRARKTNSVQDWAEVIALGGLAD